MNAAFIRQQPEIVTNVHNCSRCEHNHVQLEFKRFLKPVTAPPGYNADDMAKGIVTETSAGVALQVPNSDLIMFTHWAICPITNEPILMNIQEI